MGADSRRGEQVVDERSMQKNCALTINRIKRIRC